MWNRTSAVEEIVAGGQDVVVLQGDIPETTVESFRTYARRFVELVRKANARPILFMAWDYARLDWISMEEIAAAHRAAATELKVEVAPVGLAWSQARTARPDLDLYSRDREHPSVAGMYLSLMVIEATISGADPRTRAPDDLAIRGLQRLAPEDRAFLCGIAAQAIQDWSRSR